MDSSQTDYLKIYADLRQIFRVGRTMAVNNQSEISFSIPQGMLPWQQFFVASVAAGWAAVLFCVFSFVCTFS